MMSARVVTLALGVALVGGQLLLDSESPTVSSSSYSSSSSTSWLPGKDGKMHEEIRQVSDEQASNGKEQKHVRSAVVCKDGHCKEAARQYGPSKVNDTARMVDASIGSAPDMFESDLEPAFGMGVGNNDFGDMFGEGVADHFGSGLERSIESDIADASDRMQAMARASGARLRGMQRRLHDAGEEGSLKMGNGQSESKSMSRQYTYSNMNGQEQETETNCHDGDCTTKVRTTQKHGKSAQPKQDQQQAPQTSPKKIIFVSQ